MNKDYKETKSNAFFTLLACVLGWKYEVESKKYREISYQYFNWKDWGYETSITQIKTFKKKDKTIVQIETHRPGLLIGKAGVFIDGLKQYLKEELNENIEIDLRECKMWHRLYAL
tara:strand:- start:17 stop:361 length:345 start_codon:yes stop_codon:yes gene_type:complete